MDKILKIQGEIGVLIKDKENPYFKSQYLDINSLLDQLIPLLVRHNLVVVQPIDISFEKNTLTTIIFDGDKEIIRSSMLLPDIQDPQKMGSAITYYRRYALQSLFLLRAEDDDGNNASKSNNKASKKLEDNEDPF